MMSETEVASLSDDDANKYVDRAVSKKISVNVSKIKKIVPRAPSKIGVGFKLESSTQANMDGNVAGEATMKSKILNGKVTSLIIATAKGNIKGGAFATCDKKAVAVEAEIHGNAGVSTETVLAGGVGVKGAKGVNALNTAGRCGGGGAVAVAKNKDAAIYIESYGVKKDSTKISEKAN